MNSLRSKGSGGGGVVTELPHGPAPYAAATSACGQAVSSKPGSCQPAAAVSADFQAPSVTRSAGAPAPSKCSLPRNPAGPGAALVAWAAITLRPGRRAAEMSTTVAVRQESATGGEAAICCPLTYTVKLSSAVRSSRAAVSCSPAGSSKVRRKYRVPAGAESAGLPCGYQIQLAPSNDGAAGAAGAPIQSPRNWPGARNAVSNDAGSLHREAR